MTRIWVMIAVAGVFGPVRQAPANMWIDQGDQYYSLRHDAALYRPALEAYEQGLTSDPSSAEAAWKAAMAAWWLGTRSQDRKVRIDYFRQGRHWGEEAVRRSSESAEAHFWLGANLASYGHDKGAFTSLVLIRSIRRHMEQSARLNDRYLGAGAYRVLAILDGNVPGFAGGNKRRALERFTKALEIDPQNPVTRFYLAEYYADLGDAEKARTELAALDVLEVDPAWRPEYELMLQERPRLERRLQS